MKPMTCTLIMNGAKDGYEFRPMRCKSIREALRIAKEWGCPYRIYVGTQLIRKGWIL